MLCRYGAHVAVETTPTRVSMSENVLSRIVSLDEKTIFRLFRRRTVLLR